MATVPSPHPAGPTAPPQAETSTPAAARPEPSREGDYSPAPRRPVPSIKGLRISPPGFRATLVNISASGLLAEWGLPLKIGQAVTVAFEGTFTPQSVGAQVVRSSIASMTSPAVFATSWASRSRRRLPLRTRRRPRLVPRRLRRPAKPPIRHNWTMSSTGGKP